MPVPTMSYLTDIHFSPGATALVPEILAEMGLNRPLLVTDTGSERLDSFPWEET